MPSSNEQSKTSLNGLASLFPKNRFFVEPAHLTAFESDALTAFDGGGVSRMRIGRRFAAARSQNQCRGDCKHQLHSRRSSFCWCVDS